MSLNTPFDNKIVPDPSGDFAGVKGGVDPGGPGPGGDPITTPMSDKLVPTPGMKETPNSLSGLPARVDRIEVGGTPPTNAPDISTGSVPVAGLGQK